MAVKPKNEMNVTLEELAQQLGAEVLGAETGRPPRITGIQPVETAGAGDVTFVTDARYAAAAARSGAAAIIVAKPIEGLPKPQLVVKDVNAALITTLTLFAPEPRPVIAGVDPSARVGTNVRLAEGVSVGPHAVIENDVEVGARTVIGSGCKIGENTKIGADCRLDAQCRHLSRLHDRQSRRHPGQQHDRVRRVRLRLHRRRPSADSPQRRCHHRGLRRNRGQYLR